MECAYIAENTIFSLFNLFLKKYYIALLLVALPGSFDSKLLLVQVTSIKVNDCEKLVKSRVSSFVDGQRANY